MVVKIAFSLPYTVQTPFQYLADFIILGMLQMGGL